MSYGSEIEQDYIANNVDWRTNIMPTKNSKPILIVIGEHFINPDDVSCIKKIRTKTDLYVINLKSQPNMEFPLWANGEEVAALIKHFKIVE